MTIKQELKNILVPILKFSPVIAVLLAIAITIMGRVINITPVEYETHGAIKINIKNKKQAGFGLFNAEAGSMEEDNFMTEIEIIKSYDLIEKTMKELNWELGIFRKGEYLEVELLDERPFEIEYTIKDSSVYDKRFEMVYLGDSTFQLFGESHTFGWNEQVDRDMIAFKVIPNNQFVVQKPQSLSANDHFVFSLRSLEKLTTSINADNLFIKSVDKDISILKLYFEHGLPEKARDFVNTLMEVYIRDGQERNIMHVDRTLRYVDKELDEAATALVQAEGNLSNFRQTNQILDPKMETEFSYKEVMQIEMQQVDFNLQIAELQDFYDYLLGGNSLNNFSPNFKSLKDPIFQDAYLKVQNFELEKQDMLRKFMPTSEEIMACENKIQSLRAYLNETVKETLNSLKIKQQEMSASLMNEQEKIQSYPEKQRQLISLERRVSLNENVYNYLLKKRMELAIGRTSDFFPHQVLEFAKKPKEPSAPNAALLYGLGILLALGVGIPMAFVWGYFTTKVISHEEVINNVNATNLGYVLQGGKGVNDIFLTDNIRSNLTKVHEENGTKIPALITVSSYGIGEGKSFITTNLAKAFARQNKRVLLIDGDLYQPHVHAAFGFSNEIGTAQVLNQNINFKEAIQASGFENLDLIFSGNFEGEEAPAFDGRFVKLLKQVQENYDVILIDTSPVGLLTDAVPLMENATANLFILRKNKTKKREIRRINEFIQYWNLPNVLTVFNGEKVRRNRVRRKYYQKSKSTSLFNF